MQLTYTYISFMLIFKVIFLVKISIYSMLRQILLFRLVAGLCLSDLRGIVHSVPFQILTVAIV